MYLWREVPANLQGQLATGDNSRSLMSGSQLVSGASGEVTGNQLHLGTKLGCGNCVRPAFLDSVFGGRHPSTYATRASGNIFLPFLGQLGIQGSAWKTDLGVGVGHLQGDEGRLGSRGHYEGHILRLSAFIGPWFVLMIGWNPKTKKNVLTYSHGILYIISKSQNPLIFLSVQ